MDEPAKTRPGKKPRIALYASPECCRNPNLRLYKGYFNIAWFVRAYAALLFRHYDVITTDETIQAILGREGMRVEDNVLDEDLERIWGLKEDYIDYWRVPPALEEGNQLKSLGAGFDAQVELAAKVAKGEVERLLMFQDPDDVQTHLPEAYALIRNCTLANVGLNINAGATFWAETQWEEKKELKDINLEGFGIWRRNEGATKNFRELLNPNKQRISFIAHDNEKDKMSRLIYHYRKQLNKPKTLKLTGTYGTCQKANEYLADRLSEWERPKLQAAGATESAGHGPTGGDVVIASEIVRRWRCRTAKKKIFNARVPHDPEKDKQDYMKKMHMTKPLVRKQGLSHTVVFFIDHKHAQPHEADIHVLLRTCLHPSHGVHILLNERTAREWGENLRQTGPGGGIIRQSEEE